MHDKHVLPAGDAIISWFKSLQDNICLSLEKLDGNARFYEDLWQRKEGGGGRTRIIQGKGIEKGGVNFSVVHGNMPENIAGALGLEPNQFLATGISIVLHPANPWVPIIHMNVRYFETDKGFWWFGGGIDLTPHIVSPAEAKLFHFGLKEVCDQLSPGSYSTYKKWADEYFYIIHRNETRGVGGIFFDRLNEEKGFSKAECWNFVQNVGNAFVKLYTPAYKQNVHREFTSEDKEWQFIRRSRYVEFNLVYDKGTKFGLQTNGRIESILMSLPPRAEWHYDHTPQPGSVYAQTLQWLRKDVDWVNYACPPFSIVKG